MPLPSGHRLGSYEIVSALGSGGMGDVYRARDARLGRDVALKVLPPDVVNEPGRLERFDREARAIAALNHPHIVTIYSTEEADGVRFLTMELVDGSTIGDLISASGIGVEKFLEIAIPLADALAAAHHKQITHRDLKPGNVMISHDGRVKVLDFGLARVGGSDAGEQSLMATQAPITHQGMIVGTMPYMSPEQVEGRHLDARTDLFSLGVIFHELLSGERPFKGPSSAALMSSILRDTPPSLADRRSDLPESLARLVERLLEKQPDDRWQTARDVFNELRHIRKQVESGSARPPSSSRATPALQNLSVAVLPFTVRGPDADAEAMAAGLTDDVTTGLAKFQGLSVTAAQTTRVYKDSPLDVRQIAERVNARYVISGNVRKAGTTLRTTAQLIDARSGEQLWTESYDRKLDRDDLFTIQDDVTDHIVATLADKTGVLARSMAQAVQSGSIQDLTSGQLLVRAWGFQHRPTPSLHAELRAEIEHRLAADPHNAQLWADLANMYVVEHSLWCNPLPDPLGRALAAARRSIELDHSNQTGWLWLAVTQFHLRDKVAFEEARDRAIGINPRNSYNIAWMGNITTHAGDYERGCALTERSMRLNPAHPGWLHFAVFTRHMAAGEFEQALYAARRANMRDFFWMHFAIAAACGHLGKHADGSAAAAEMTRLAPFLADDATLREFVTRWYWDEAMIERILEGLDRVRSDGRSDGRSEGRSDVRSDARSDSRSGSDPGREKSIAVLPFTDLSEKRDQEWFCDGIAEEIMTALSPLPGLRVAARASSFSFKGKSDDLRSIADKLHVDTVLEGSVRRAADRVRITTQLSDAREGRQLWSERFDRELKDIFDVQDEIAHAIVNRLKVSFGEGERLVQKRTANMEAYEWLLRGRTFVTKRGPAIAQAVDYFEKAVALDPELADAHAGVADAYRLLAIYGFTHPAEALTKAHASVARTLALVPNHPEALATLANLKHSYEWRFAEAQELTRRALAADPNHVRALAEGAITLITATPGGPTAEVSALVDARVARARNVDPLNAWVLSVEALIRYFTGRIDEAVDAAGRAIAIDPENFTAHWSRVIALASSGREDDALDAAEDAFAVFGRHPSILAEVAAIYAQRGNMFTAESILHELNERAKTGFVGFMVRAAVAASAGYPEDARQLLEQAIDQRDSFLTLYRLPACRSLRADAACTSMLRTRVFNVAAQ